MPVQCWAFALVPKELGYGLSGCSKLFVQCWPFALVPEELGWWLGVVPQPPSRWDLALVPVTVLMFFASSVPLPSALDVERTWAWVQAPLKRSLDLGMLPRTQRVGPQHRMRLHPLGDHHQVC